MVKQVKKLPLQSTNRINSQWYRLHRIVGGLVLDAISGIFYRSKGQNLTGFGTSDQKYQK